VRIKCSEVWWNNNVIWWGVTWIYGEQCRKLLPGAAISLRPVRHSPRQASQLNSSGRNVPLSRNAWRGLCLTGRRDHLIKPPLFRPTRGCHNWRTLKVTAPISEPNHSTKAQKVNERVELNAKFFFYVNLDFWIVLRWEVVSGSQILAVLQIVATPLVVQALILVFMNALSIFVNEPYSRMH